MTGSRCDRSRMDSSEQCLKHDVTAHSGTYHTVAVMPVGLGIGGSQARHAKRPRSILVLT